LINLPFATQTQNKKSTWSKDLKQNWVLYLLFIPTGLYFLIFNYIPMFGILIAFEDFKVSRGIFGSTWVGWQNFIDLFSGDTFPQVLRNTFAITLLNMTIGFVLPIIFALLLSEIRSKTFKRSIQTITYMPHFVAAVVVCQLVREFVGNSGAITQVLTFFGLQQQNWLANPTIPIFWLIISLTGLWQEIGFGSIIYVAAIANVSPDFHEAAAVDGASRFQRMIHITLPTIMPLITMMFILNCGLAFVLGFDKVLLLYMPSTYVTSDVLFTYTYRMAFGSAANYGLSTASGLFQSVIAFLLLVTSNVLSRRVSKTSLF
jgi:putative aldouronate transport system permease protein